MSDLISRQAIKDAMMQETDEYCKDVSDLEYRKFLFVFVANLTDRFNLLSPVIPVQKVGKWIERTDGVGAHCDQCGKYCQIQFTADRNYCPSCGCYMVENVDLIDR